MDISNKETVNAYNSSVDKYIAESPQIVSGELKEWIDGNLSKLDNQSRILEIGSGSGKDADYFYSQGYRMELTDASQGFVDYLNKKGHSARLLDILSDSIDVNYDMIFADAVFLHFTEDELLYVLKKAHSALRSEGRLAFTLKVGQGEETTTRKLDVPRYFHYWMQEDIERLLKEAGFSDFSSKSDTDYRGESRPNWLYVTAIR